MVVLIVWLGLLSSKVSRLLSWCCMWVCLCSWWCSCLVRRLVYYCRMKVLSLYVMIWMGFFIDVYLVIVVLSGWLVFL